MGLTSLHDFYGSWHLYISRSLLGHWRPPPPCEQALTIVSIQSIKSRIWDTVDDWYKNNLTNDQVSAVFHTRVICRSVSPKFKELCLETPCLRPSQGHKHGGRKVKETSVTEFSWADLGEGPRGPRSPPLFLPLTLWFCFENRFIICSLILSSETLTLLYFASRIRPQCCMLHALKTEVFSLGKGRLVPLFLNFLDPPLVLLLKRKIIALEILTLK